MDYTYFIFAFFVFILVITTIFIAKKIKSPKDKHDGAMSEKEKKLFKLYQNLEDMIAGAMEYMEESKKEVAQSQDKISDMIDNIDTILSEMSSNVKDKAFEDDLNNIEQAENPSSEFNKPVLISNNLSRRDKVLLLKKEGQNVKQISKVLGMSQGEVKLIIGLDK